jgi:shikimate dehydrogenase
MNVDADPTDGGKIDAGEIDAGPAVAEPASHPRRLGVLGWPVAHSRSPAMMNAALRALGMDGEWRYQLLPVPPERFEETVRALGEAGFVGANVTIPHKRAALALADTASETARAIGAANTLTFAAEGTIAAENTDAPGFLTALGVDLRGLSAQVLGAGGSARAVVWALRESGAREVAIWNRTPARARELAHELGAGAVEHPIAADVLVNCTPVGLMSGVAAGPATGAQVGPSSGAAKGATGVRQSASDTDVLNLLELTFDQVGKYAHVVDLVYSSKSTPLLAAARAHGAHAVDGREMLVAQGAIGFELWTGVAPPRDVMRAALDG